jgi:dihydropteroate synthase
VIAVQRGARIVRVHDVAATVDALKLWQAVQAVPAVRKDAAPSIRWPDED